MQSINNVLIIDFNEVTKHDKVNIDILTANTVNTWQPGRSIAEKHRDTELGKFAEDCVISALDILNIKNYHSYDSFRKDNYGMHAPFDGLLTNNLNGPLIDLIYNAVKEETSKLSAATRDIIRKMNALTVEIKSTRLAQKYKDRAGFTTYQDRTQITRLVDSLKGLDFLTYPFFIRQGNFTFFEYCLYVNKYFLHTDLKGASLAEYVKNIELGNACDIYMRVFVDEVEKKALIMGFIDRFSFFRYPATHKLVLPGKSENALYFVKKLRDARPLTDLEHVLKN